MKRSLSEIYESPSRWLRLIVRKTRLFISSYEIPDTEDYYLARRLCVSLRFSFLTYGILFPAAVIGLLLIRRRFYRETELLALLWLGNAMSVIAFFILARYRMPSVPAMIVCAAFFLNSLHDWLEEHSYRNIVLSLVAWLGRYSLCRGANLVGIPGQVATASWINVGEFYRNAGDYRKADVAFYSALSNSPDDFMAMNSLGVSLFDQGRSDAAAAIFRQVLARQPTYEKAHFNLGNILAAGGHIPEAIKEYRTAFLLSPAFSAAGINLANLLSKTGAAEEATRVYNQIISLEPQNAAARYNFGLFSLTEIHARRFWNLTRQSRSIRVTTMLTMAKALLACA